MILTGTLMRMQSLRRTLRIDRIFVAIGRHLSSHRGDVRPIPSKGRRLFVDVSVISKQDAGTGIQRVVRSIVNQIEARSIEGWQVQFVSETRRSGYFVVGESRCINTHSPINAIPGDVFLGLDFSLDAVFRHRDQLRRMRRAGCKMIFLVHDLLPAKHPDWFSDRTVVRFNRWIRELSVLGDGFLCNSGPTLRDLSEFLVENGVSTGDFWTEVLPMGSEVEIASHCSISEDPPVMAQTEGPFVLAVGTIEPRKGYDDLLDAFEFLWSKGHQEALVIVGKPGWKTQEVQSRIERLQRVQPRLVWLSDVSDKQLVSLYRRAIGLVAASKAEGYGLPILEAQAVGCPVLARDIPAFREREQAGIDYFPSSIDAVSFAARIANWLHSRKSTRAQPVAVSSWRHSADRLVELVCGEKL